MRAKFVRGTLKPVKEKAKEGPVEVGCYSTAINLHNPNYSASNIAKKAVLLFDASKPNDPATPMPPYPSTVVRLQPDWGLQIDGDHIRDVLLRDASGKPGPKVPIFIKGWVVIESHEPLDVVAVYMVRGLHDHAVSITTERVTPHHPSDSFEEVC